MQNLLLVAQRDHDKWKQKLAATVKIIALLEVPLKKIELKEQLYDHTLSMIKAKMIERRILYKIPESEVFNKDYANLLAFGLIGSVTESQACKF